MRSLRERYGPWALVAGAAEGIGEGFSRCLAASDFNVILVDINAKAAQALAMKLRQEFQTETQVLTLDLSAPDAPDLCLKAIEQKGCRLMVYVAAWSRVERFLNLDSSDLDELLAVNTRTQMHLVHGFSKWLVSQNLTGGMVLMSSLAGMIGPPFVAPYAATKSFTIRFAEALHHELKVHGIDILACVAGTVSTPAYWNSRPDFSKIRPHVMQPAEIAEYALGKIGRQVLCIPGWRNRMQFFFLIRMIPARLARFFVNSAMKKMYPGV